MRSPLRFLLTALACCCISFCAQAFALSDNTLSIKEAETRLLLRGETPEVALSITNVTPQVARAKIELELIDTEGKIRARTETTLSIALGATTYTIPFSGLTTALQTESQTPDLIWYRLRYRLTKLEEQ